MREGGGCETQAECDSIVNAVKYALKRLEGYEEDFGYQWRYIEACMSAKYNHVYCPEMDRYNREFKGIYKSK